MPYLSYESLDHFEHARRWALFEQAWQWLNRRPYTLLCFDEVRTLLALSRMVDRGLEEIDLTRVIGSVTRQRDFTRAFRPRKAFNRDRWRRVDDLMAGPGFPPIEVYQVGTVYFVVDGHHRISVARAHRMRTIEAHVTEWMTSFRIELDDSLDRIRARVCRKRFYSQTPCLQ